MTVIASDPSGISSKFIPPPALSGRRSKGYYPQHFCSLICHLVHSGYLGDESVAFQFPLSLTIWSASTGGTTNIVNAPLVSAVTKQ